VWLAGGVPDAREGFAGPGAGVSAVREAVRVFDGAARGRRHDHVRAGGRHQPPRHGTGRRERREPAVDAGEVLERKGAHPRHRTDDALDGLARPSSGDDASPWRSSLAATGS